MKKIPIETSARHCHLSRKHIDILFGNGYQLTSIKELSQKGQFLAKERVDIEVNGISFKNVAILFPERENTQVEISLTDSRYLKINAPINLSGNLNEAQDCYISYNTKKVLAKGSLIIAQRHLHCDIETARELKLINNDIISIQTDSIRSVIFNNVIIRIDKSFTLALHIDTDESNACNNAKSGYLIKESF